MLHSESLELTEHIIGPWKLFLKAIFRPNTESSIKVCHKTKLNWDFNWLYDKVVFFVTEGKAHWEWRGETFDEAL